MAHHWHSRCQAQRMNSPSNFVTFGILGLAVLVATMVPALVLAFSPAAVREKRALVVALGLVAWLGLSGALAASGFFHEWTTLPPRALLILGPTLALPAWLGFSRWGSAIAEKMPTFILVGVHAFRLPLELVMHEAAREGTMPWQMSFAGFNFDIVTGVLATCVLLFYWRRDVPTFAARAFGIVGTLLLATIVIIAVASLPMVAAFGSDPSRLNTWIADFPFVWLPSSLVSAATLFHVLLWRKLAMSRVRCVLPASVVHGGPVG